MIILQESASAQIIAFIPRQDTYNGLTITDEQTGVTTSVTIVSNTVGEYYNTIEAVFTLVENHFYILKVKQGSTVVFQDKVFCTNQSIPTFSVNEGQYINNSSNNDFILYE